MSAASDVALPPPAPPVNPTTSQSHWKPVARSPQQLRVHPALDGLGWINLMSEFNDAVWMKNLTVPEPILITTGGTILANFGRWQTALREGEHEIDCLEHPFSKHQALEFILSYHRPRQGWNDFVRIRLARTQRADFQQKALANLRTGGKYKGLTNLLEADRINVCREIAKLAGTGTTNVGKVEAILGKAHPSIIAALQNGLLRIHRAWLWCKLSKLEQLDEFARYEEKRSERKILQGFSPEHASGSQQFTEVVEGLQRVEARNPGSIIIRTSRSKHTVLILGEDLLAALDA